MPGCIADAQSSTSYACLRTRLVTCKSAVPAFAMLGRTYPGRLLPHAPQAAAHVCTLGGAGFVTVTFIYRRRFGFDAAPVCEQGRMAGVAVNDDGDLRARRTAMYRSWAKFKSGEAVAGVR